MLIVFGESDPHVPAEGRKILIDTLPKAGVKHTIVCPPANMRSCATRETVTTQPPPTLSGPRRSACFTVSFHDRTDIANQTDAEAHQGLDIVWADGKTSSYPLVYLRSMCPCASCKEVRAAGGSGAAHPALQQVSPEKPQNRSLTILPGNYATPLTVTAAERVGNYALRLDWSDSHSSGIYSYQYLREIMREQR